VLFWWNQNKKFLTRFYTVLSVCSTSEVRSIGVQYDLFRLYPILSTTIPFAVRLNQDGINTGRPLIGSYNSHICNMDNGHLALWLRVVRRWVLRWGIIFSKGLGDNILFFSLCQSVWVEEQRFYVCFCSSLEACLGMFLLVWSVKLEWGLAETCRVFIGRTRTYAQLRSERTEDRMRTYCGRDERSVNEVVELWTRVNVMGTK